MKKEEIETIIRHAINLGRAEILSMQIGGMKYITRPQALNYLKANGYKPSTLAEWEDEGLIHSVQVGSGCTHKYKSVDIQKALLQTSLMDATHIQ